MAISFIKPNTALWYKERLGCFTSSEIVRLLKGGIRPMTDQELKSREKGNTRKTVDILFGAGAITYINEKVAERINKIAKATPITKPMQWGLDNESDALELASKITGIVFREAGLFKLDGFTGGTPDAIVGKRKVLGIAEVKCLSQENHSEICELETVSQLREYDESFYAQCQMNMYVTKAKWALFISYDPRPMGVNNDGELVEALYDENNFIYCIKMFKIKRDEPYITDISNRILAASVIVTEKIHKRRASASNNLKRYKRTLKKA